MSDPVEGRGGLSIPGRRGLDDSSVPGAPHPAKEIWVAQKPGDGSLQAKVGAMALCNQRAYLFLDKHFYIKRGVA
jgi:hypothetical protein